MPKIEPYLLVIVGETASGKSALALQLAQLLNGEIICADSWTVRRGLTIGTAKPSLADQALVPHHLLDIIGPDEDFTAAVFKGLASEAIKEIAHKGKLPIMVGGTGLYIDGVLYDYGFLDEGDRQARTELNKLSVTELLERIDEAGLNRSDVDIRNKRRLIRLLESNGAQPTRGDFRQRTIIIGLNIEREELQERIIARTNTMLSAGLEEEVRHLSETYGWNCEALKGVGYAQWQDYFNGQQTLKETTQKIIKATLGLAKRQRTWFKRNKSIQWFSIPVNTSDIVDYITTNLDK